MELYNLLSANPNWNPVKLPVKFSHYLLVKGIKITSKCTYFTKLIITIKTSSHFSTIRTFVANKV